MCPQDRHIMSQTALERRDFPVPCAGTHAGSDLSRPGQRGSTCYALDPFQALAAERPVIRFHLDSGLMFRRKNLSFYINHPARRRHQSPDSARCTASAKLPATFVMPWRFLDAAATVRGRVVSRASKNLTQEADIG